ncbi:MAG: alkaline phosphatase family protein [Minicystis sp.]
MARLRDGLMAMTMVSLLAACGGGGGTGTGGAGGGAGGHGGQGTGGTGGVACGDTGAGQTGVAHVIIVIQENHTFDTYFGKWCTAAAGSNPTCTAGPSCCEGAPATEPSGASPITLDDTTNAAYDPDHSQACELSEINGGLMDKFVKNTDANAPSGCADARNFAVASDAAAAGYHDLATKYAVADRYFQSMAGQSSSNDMYFAVAKKVFIDNAAKPDTVGKECETIAQTASYQGQTIADLLKSAGKTVNWYAEGYQKMVDAKGGCPNAPSDCGFHLPTYPCVYAPSDIPFLYYEQFAKDETFMRDYAKLTDDLASGSLPDVSFVKALGYKTEHPGYGTKISDGMKIVTDLVAAVDQSCYKDSTLILVTWDEGGGFYDHVPPPPTSTVDNVPYGTRVPLLAIGRYAKKGAVSHVTMEHSSVVKFLEFNYLDGKTGRARGARRGGEQHREPPRRERDEADNPQSVTRGLSKGGSRRGFLEGGFSKGASRRGLLEGGFSKGASRRGFLEGASRRGLLEGGFSKELPRRGLLEGASSKGASRRSFLEGGFSKELPRRGSLEEALSKRRPMLAAGFLAGFRRP